MWRSGTAGAIFYMIFSSIAIFFISCASKNAETTINEDFSGIVALHKEMNDKHGKTSSYFANLAIANENYDQAYSLLYKECKVGSTMACLNAYYIGEERALSEYDSQSVARDLQSSVRKGISACSNNESLGCVNVFFAFDALNDNDDFVTSNISSILNTQNNDRIIDKALNLTKQECANNDATSCFYHARILRSMDNYANVEEYINKGLDLGYVLSPFVYLQTQSPLNVDYFKRACSIDEALSCRYVAYWFDKYEGDSKRAAQFYKKACSLGIDSVCTENKKQKSQIDEVGAPSLQRR